MIRSYASIKKENELYVKIFKEQAKCIQRILTDNMKMKQEMKELKARLIKYENNYRDN